MNLLFVVKKKKIRRGVYFAWDKAPGSPRWCRRCKALNCKAHPSAKASMSETNVQGQSTPAYRALFNFIGEAIFVADGETGMIVDANPAAETLVGRSLNEIRALHHYELHPSDEAEASRQAFAEFVRHPEAFRAKKAFKQWEVV